MTTATLTLTLPLPPRRQGNADRHWRYRHQNKKRYLEQCDTLQLLKRIPPPPLHPFAFCDVTAVIIVRRLNDTDNLFSRLKWAQDFLTSRGYIADDSARRFRWLTLPEQIVSHTESPSVTFTLTAHVPAEAIVT